MNSNRRAELIRRFLEEYSAGVMEDKGNAYSRGEENSNSNFYRVAEALGSDPMSVAWTYALKHIDALSAYIKGGCDGKLIGSEPVEGRIGDAVNYLLILYSILVQEGVLGEDKPNPHQLGTRENPYLYTHLRPHDVAAREAAAYWRSSFGTLWFYEPVEKLWIEVNES